MFEAVETLVAEHAGLEQKMSDPSVHADPVRAKKLGQRYAEVGAIVKTYREWQQVGDDLEVARELSGEDEAFAAEAEALERKLHQLDERLQRLLVPRDPTDSKDAIFEIKAGEGGEESALFAGDLLRMYLRYAETKGWKTEVIDVTESGLGGYKSVTVAIKAKGTPEAGEAPFACLLYTSDAADE